MPVKLRSVFYITVLVGVVAIALPFFSLGQGGGSEPVASVELNSGILKTFLARGGDKTVILTWSATDESGISHYSLYRGFAPVGKFSLVSEIPVHSGTPKGFEYTFVDEWVINGVSYYYKIAYKTSNYTEIVHPMLVSATPSTRVTVANPESLQQYQLFASSANLMTAPTTVDFYVRNSGNVRLTVFDLKGKEIKTLVSRDFYPGIYTLDLTNQDLEAGVYFLKMTGDNGFSTMQKVLVVK